MAHDHQDSDRSHNHDHKHGNAKDRELKSILRYIKIAPRMWRSVVNNAVVDLIDPRPGETVIDIGAGMGPGVMRSARSGAEVMAVDPTPFMRSVMGAPATYVEEAQINQGGRRRGRSTSRDRRRHRRIMVSQHDAPLEQRSRWRRRDCASPGPRGPRGAC